RARLRLGPRLELLVERGDAVDAEPDEAPGHLVLVAAPRRAAPEEPARHAREAREAAHSGCARPAEARQARDARKAGESGGGRRGLARALTLEALPTRLARESGAAGPAGDAGPEARPECRPGLVVQAAAEPGQVRLYDLEPELGVGQGGQDVRDEPLIDDHGRADRHGPHLVGAVQVAPPGQPVVRSFVGCPTGASAPLTEPRSAGARAARSGNAARGSGNSPRPPRNRHAGPAGAPALVGLRLLGLLAEPGQLHPGLAVPGARVPEG